MPYVRALAFVVTLTAAFVFVVPVQALARRRGWALQHNIQTGFCRVVCAIIGVTVEARGALPGDAPRFVTTSADFDNPHALWPTVSNGIKIELIVSRYCTLILRKLPLLLQSDGGWERLRVL